MGEVKHPLFKCSINDVRKYFELAVWMSSEPSAGLDPILVDNTQVTEASMAIIIVSENGESISELTLLLYPGKNTIFATHEAKENVWNVLSQPWSAWPLSVEGLRTSLAVDMFNWLVGTGVGVEKLLRKVPVGATERRVEERRANSLTGVVGCGILRQRIKTGPFYKKTFDPLSYRIFVLNLKHGLISMGRSRNATDNTGEGGHGSLRVDVTYPIGSLPFATGSVFLIPGENR